MKKTRILTVMLCITAGLGLLSFAACKPDEEKPTATLTLSAGEGGTIAQTTYEVEVGASLAEYLKEIKPTAEEGLSFAGWYNGSTLLSSETMPESGISLTAKYNVPYTISLYLADVKGTYGAATTTQETAIYGEAFTYSPSTPHYTLDTAKENKITSEKLGKGESFIAYLKRETYGVHYYVNAPAGSEADFGEEVPSASVVYGNKTVLPSDGASATPEWFRMAGWATEADGAVVYQAGEEVAPESDLFLYAVWDEAYQDRFGGGDFLFFPQTEEGVAILKRAGKEYRGTHDGNNFSFKEGDKEIVKGQVSANGTFMYYREGLDEETYRHYNAYRDVFDEDAATIKFDNYSNGTYTVGGTVKHGVISYKPSLMFYTFEGDGEHFDFIITDVLGSDGSSETVFVTVGEEFGAYYLFQFYYEETEIKADIPSVSLNLYGLGSMEFVDVENDEVIVSGSYEPKGNGVVTLKWVDEDNVSHVVNVKLLEYGGEKIVVYEDGWAGTYTDEEGNKLILDGYSGTIGSAVWTSQDGSTKKEGMYTFDYSPLGDILRLQEANGDVTSYRISIDEKFSELGDGDYKEYILYNTQLGYALLMLGENNTATVYTNVATSDEKFEGKVTKVDGQKDLMLFTSEDEQLIFEFKLYSGRKVLDDYCISDYFYPGAQIYCHYFTYYPVYEEGAQGVQFLEAEDGDKLILGPKIGTAIYGPAVYTSGDTSTVGLYNTIGSLLGHVYIEFYDYGEQEYLFFEYFAGDEDTDPSFVKLEGVSNVYYVYNPYYFTADATYTLFLFDGEKDKVAALLYSVEESETADSIFGTFTYDDATSCIVLTPDEESEYDQPISLKLGYEDGYDVFFFRNDEFGTNETITFEGNPQLTLDAYGFARYKDPDGNPLEGKYCFAEAESLSDDVYRIYAIFPVDEGSGYSGYFDIDVKNKTYVSCNRLIGVFYEDTARKETLEFNGHDEVVYENIDNEKVKGTYTVLDYDEIGRLIAEVKVGNESYQIRCYYLLDDEGDLIGHYTKEVDGEGTYVSDKREYLTVNKFGDAVYTDEYGISYSGTVTRFTEHVVSFQGEYAQNAIYCKLDGSAFSVPESGMLIDGDTLVKYLGGEETAIKIDGVVTKIAPLAFSEQIYGSNYAGAPIVSLDLNNVTEIGENAFNGCSVLKSVKGANLKTIGGSAFYACIELTTLDLPALEEIGEMAFHLCESLTKVTLEKVKTVYAGAFSDCYELSEISLPAAEKLYEGVFFDCYALKLVTLGANLTQIGTPDEVVTGVFERDSAFEQVPLKVVFEGTKAPTTVGKQLFAGVTNYSVVVPDIDTVKKFYLAEGWADYNNCVGCEGNEEYVGTYYGYNYGDICGFVLNEAAHELTGYSLVHRGAYEVREGKLYALTFDAGAENNYTERELGTFDENGNIVSSYYTYFKAGKEFTIQLGGDDTVVFTPGEYSSLAAGVAYEVPAKWTKDGTQKDAKVQLSFSASYRGTMYLKVDGDRCKIDYPYVSGGKVTASLTGFEFDPVVTRYTMSDDSLLALSQNNKEATEYTVSVVLAAIRDENNLPFSLVNVAVEKNADGTFTAKESYLFAGYSYKLTFAVNSDGTFSYTYARDRRIVVNSADGNAQVVVYQSESGEVTSVTLFINNKEVGNGEYDTKDFVLTHEKDSKVYRWLVYDYTYAGIYTFTFMGDGETLTGVLTVSGTVVQGAQDGVFVVAIYEGSTRTAFYMRGMDEVYGKVEDSDITQGEGEEYLTVQFKGNTYFVTLDLQTKSVAIVFADVTYQSSEKSDVEGSVRVTKDSDGKIESVTLTVDGKSYTQYTDYGYYYVITDGTDYFNVTLSTNGSEISELSAKEFTSGEFKVTLLVRSNNEVAGVVSATYQSKDVVVTFEYDYKNGKDIALLSFTVDGANKNYLANITDTTMNELVEKTLTTTDGNYRITLLMNGNDSVYEVIKFEQKDGEGFKELTVTYSEAVDYSDEYNYEIDITDGTYYYNYYFNIVKDGDEWKATSVVPEW